MSIRNCGELGLSLQKIVSRLLENDRLVNLLYYEDSDPLNQPLLTKEQKQKLIFDKLIKIVPKPSTNIDSKSQIIIYILAGAKNPKNKEFRDVTICISSFVPLSNWIIKDTNLRPFAILGEIQASLDNKTINGLGRLSGGDFELNMLTEETSGYKQLFNLVEYD